MTSTSSRNRNIHISACPAQGVQTFPPPFSLTVCQRRCSSVLSAIMNQCKLWFVLLLPLCFCVSTEEKMVKIVRSEPDMTPICSSATLHTITLIVCKIKTDLNGGEGCRLLYQHGHDFVHQCDPRFKLTSKNQSVFLRLTRLTPEDSGNYTCECSHFHGTHFLQLQIQLEAGVAETSRSPVRTLAYAAVISSATGFLIVTGVLFGLNLRKKHCRDHPQSEPSTDKCELGGVYSNLQHSAADLYQTTSSVTLQPSADENLSARKAAVDQERNGKIHEDCDIYENVNQGSM